jgi:hypothetical protein
MSARTPGTGTIRNAFIAAHPFPLTTEIEEREAEFTRWMATRDAEVLNEAADAIQALHPGEVKASVVSLRERAAAVLSAAGV